MYNINKVHSISRNTWYTALHMTDKISYKCVLQIIILDSND